MSFVLDTHAIVLALTKPAKLGKDAQRAFRQIEIGQAQGYVPAAATAEVLLLRDLGRIELGVAEIKATLADIPALLFLPLDLAQLETFATLSSIRDPFDRLIVGAALATESKLITKDSLLTDSGLVEVVW